MLCASLIFNHPHILAFHISITDDNLSGCHGIVKEVTVINSRLSKLGRELSKVSRKEECEKQGIVKSREGGEV